MTLTVLFMQHKFSAHAAANFPKVTRETKLSAIQTVLLCFAGHIASAIFSSRVPVFLSFFLFFFVSAAKFNCCAGVQTASR